MGIGTIIVLKSESVHYEKQKHGRRPNIIWLLTKEDEEQLLNYNVEEIKWIKVIKLTDESHCFIRKITDISRLNLSKDNGIIISWRNHE